MCTLLLAAPCWAGALVFDIAISVRERQDAVAPVCAARRRLAAPASAVQQYEKGICLLYGLNGGADPPAVVRLLRAAAQAHDTQAQMALADYLQTRSSEDQQEALQWYLRAQEGGDARAQGRHQHLQQQLQALRAPDSLPAVTEPPEGTIVNPLPGEMDQLYRDGYHCHSMPLGQRWCHNSADGI